MVLALPAWAQRSPYGYWQTEDGGGVIQTFDCGGRLCARLAGIVLDRPDDPTPTDYRGVSQCHLPLINDAAPEGTNLWRGHIIDPRNGKVYGVEVHVDERGRLAIRGFLGFALLGRTTLWDRYDATPPPDCRITSPDALNAANGPARPRG